MEIDARHLRLVKSIADAGSITRAASALGSTQPAVTRQLRRIENSLGGDLFVRSPDGVETTSLGALVVGRANTVLTVLDSLRADLSAATAAATPAQVHVGVRNGQALLGLMHGLRETLPGTEIVTSSETNLSGLIDLVAAGRLDLAIIHEFVGYELQLDPRVVATEIAVEPVFVLLSESHQLADQTEVDLADLADDNWLLSPLDVDRESDCLAGACAVAGFQPKIVHYLSDTLAFALIRAGEAIAPCVPAIRYAATAVKPLAGSPIRIRQLLLTEHNGPMVDYVDKLAAFVSDELAAGRDRQPAYAAWRERQGTA